MIKIKATNKPWEEQINSYVLKAYIDENSTTTQAISLFCSILQLEGYGDEAIRSALSDVEYDFYESISTSNRIMTERREIQ